MNVKFLMQVGTVVPSSKFIAVYCMSACLLFGLQENCSVCGRLDPPTGQKQIISVEISQIFGPNYFQ